MGSYTLPSKGNLSLKCILVVYREDEVVVVSGSEKDFEVNLEGGNSYGILALVKENFNNLFHT